MRRQFSAVALALLSLCGCGVDAFTTTSIHPLQHCSSGRSFAMMKKSSNHDHDHDVLQTSSSHRTPLSSFAQVLLERSNTLKSAGFYDEEQQQLEPVYAGFKTNIMLFLAAVGYKWYRSIFINKVRTYIHTFCSFKTHI